MRLEDIKKIGIAGAGTMGSGIAQIFARKGYEVVVTDIAEEYLEKSKRLVQIFNESLIGEGIMTAEEASEAVSLISYSTSKQVFADCQLIIEAIVEKMDIKQVFWQEVEGIAAKDVYFATNTSGLSINGISKLVENKSRFIGMHFWNPPHIIPLVELIRADDTSDDTVAVLRELLTIIEKEPVVVQKDAPGFIGNRLQFAAFREALHIVNEGIADIGDVDRAMRYGPGFRYPIIGPLQTADLGGLDTFYYISSYLFNELSDMKEPPEMLKKLMDTKELGVKSKKGFYDYSDGKDEEAIKNRDKMLFNMLKYIHMKK
ncbi:3-hydroxyacyl-CoA dehydrogenase family protein [Gudongella oleilytica]|uniref:3-hydroxyacyl-CoA dehydrogenase family protein n=1 Tax=Gudongella oleilytica TaxID=1582259 RepID=UPI002A3724FF|nr:3-hydroxyacyl-CoA dehydrogenase family protein [Gudongella oleilytica]MDY0257887.1 3-hydroxyacyl-CoA dehydrogenase family protein [Gudongella oleilytica]